MRAKVEEQSYDVIHNVPTTEAAVAEQNFMRGEIAANEQLLKLAEEYRQWKEGKTK